MNGVDETMELQNELNAKVDLGLPDQQLEALYFAKNAALHNRLSWGYCSDLAERIIGHSSKFTPENWDTMAEAVKELDFKETAAETVGGTIAGNCTLRAFNAILVWDMFKYTNLRKKIEEKWCTEKNLILMQSDPEYFGPAIHYTKKIFKEKLMDCELPDQLAKADNMSRGARAYERRYGKGLHI